MEALFSNLPFLNSESSLLAKYAVLATALGGAFCIYGLSLAIYRLYFDPLAGFPGPKIAAATGWYEFYHDVIRGGQYVFIIEEMHKQYGPILRINPYEIVIDDPDFYNEVYVAGNTRRTEIWPRYRQGLGLDGCHHVTANHELHRRRRKPLESFFSRLGLDRMEGMIIEEAKSLDTRLEAMRGSKKVVRLDHIFSAFAGDVIGRICCEKPPDMMKQAEFDARWHNMIEGTTKQAIVFMQLPGLARLIQMIPPNFLSCIYPDASQYNSFRKVAMEHIVDVKRENLSRKKVDENAASSIFRHIVSSDIPESERSVERLNKEAMVLQAAGTATTARTMGVMAYYTLRNPHIRERLGNELKVIMAGYPNNLPRWSDFEKLPYLQATIKEGLRLSPGVIRRLVRCSPDVAIQYKQWKIPKYTPVGMGSYTMHLDPEVYPEPHKFMPERWLGEYDPKMNKNWVPFSRGSRSCLGMNLAYAEMNWAMAVIFRPDAAELSLFETDESDVVIAADYTVPMPQSDSRGTRVMVN